MSNEIRCVGEGGRRMGKYDCGNLKTDIFLRE